MYNINYTTILLYSYYNQTICLFYNLIMDDDLWDTNVDERQLQMNFHNNEVERENKKIKKNKYYEGFINGTDYNDEVSYKKGFDEGYNLSLDLGLCLGKCNSIIRLSELELIMIDNNKLNRIKEIKSEIELNTYKISREVINEYFRELNFQK